MFVVISMTKAVQEMQYKQYYRQAKCLYSSIYYC